MTSRRRRENPPSWRKNDAEAVRENALKETADDAKTSSVAHLKLH
jgi:hypothetical protein